MPRQRIYREMYIKTDVCKNMSRERFFKTGSKLKVTDDNSVILAARNQINH